ncbi:hypothetical protein DPM19_00925 [Actinomadura craniellae]|uniref:DUF4760 domain-containing protein n=1 Tax=Actinomadura craniellae TaxID=2231787 RepID=A0A365HCD2_9ACTN|nr:hypothetical protein [Actinomadura craniellae]RAY16765.1 hypothetical protein DPM19_00925 [Actinomadura craniellae]
MEAIDLIVPVIGIIVGAGATIIGALLPTRRSRKREMAHRLELEEQRSRNVQYERLVTLRASSRDLLRLAERYVEAARDHRSPESAEYRISGGMPSQLHHVLSSRHTDMARAFGSHHDIAARYFAFVRSCDSLFSLASEVWAYLRMRSLPGRVAATPYERLFRRQNVVDRILEPAPALVQQAREDRAALKAALLAAAADLGIDLVDG